jgi:hypothetical protein
VKKRTDIAVFERVQFLSFGAILCRAPESDILQSIVNEYLEQCRHGNPTGGLIKAAVTE